MRKAILFLLCCWAGSACAQKYFLAPAESSLRWTGTAAFSTYTLSGDVEPANGMLVLKDEKIIQGSVTIDMGSIRSDDFKKLTRHLKSADFFAVKEFPEARFVLSPSLSINARSASGVFEIRDKQQEETIQLNISSSGDRLEITGALTLDRTAYGIYYNSPNYFENIKQQAIADEMELSFILVFER